MLRLKHPITGVDTGRGLALTTDGNHRWCAVDPRQGTALTVAEAVLNLACVGARPLAVVNCLNFGNPEHPEVMWQLSEAIDGMAEACRALGTPGHRRQRQPLQRVAGADIDPTPVIGMLGLVDALDRRPPGVGLVDGRPPRAGRRRPSPSCPARRGPGAKGHRGGRLPVARPGRPHRRSPTSCARLVADGLVAGVHDVGAGGVGPGAGRDGGAVRASASTSARIHDAAELFSESPSRVVRLRRPRPAAAACSNVCERGRRAHRPHRRGRRRPALVKGLLDLALADATAAWRDRLPDALGAGTAQG